MIRQDEALRTLNVGLLNKAADLIEEHGWWHKGDAVRPAGSLCIIDAVRRAVVLNANDRQFVDTAAKFGFIEQKPRSLALFLIIHLGLHPYPSPTSSLIEWNDAPERIKQEVLDALRNTAKELEQP